MTPAATKGEKLFLLAAAVLAAAAALLVPVSVEASRNLPQALERIQPPQASLEDLAAGDADHHPALPALTAADRLDLGDLAVGARLEAQRLGLHLASGDLGVARKTASGGQTWTSEDNVRLISEMGVKTRRPTFQGLWTDPVTGLAYARARWYDARNASWLSEDPLLDVDSPNLYAFVGWGPHVGTDPLGLGTCSDGTLPDWICAPIRALDRVVRRTGEETQPRLEALQADVSGINQVSTHTLGRGSFFARGWYWAIGQGMVGAALLNADVRTAMISPTAAGATGADVRLAEVADFASHPFSGTARHVKQEFTAGLEAELAGDWQSASEVWGALGFETYAAVEGGLGVARLGTTVARRLGLGISETIPDGIIYRRVDLNENVKPYYGKAKSEARFLARQSEELRQYESLSIDVDFKFEIVERAEPGFSLDLAEESWIRSGGGPTNKSNPSGQLSNKRYEMSEQRYRLGGGLVPRPEGSVGR